MYNIDIIYNIIDRRKRKKQQKAEQRAKGEEARGKIRKRNVGC